MFGVINSNESWKLTATAQRSTLGLAGKGGDQLQNIEKDPETLIKYMIGAEFEPISETQSVDTYKSYFTNKNGSDLNVLEEVSMNHCLIRNLASCVFVASIDRFLKNIYIFVDY